MTFSEQCIRRPVMTILLMLCLCIIGIVGYINLSVSALPSIDFPVIQVTANLPGASAETMATSVAIPLERQFTTIAGVKTITSANSLGSTIITIEFNLNRNIDGAALDVQAAISVAQANLPQQMLTPPSFQKVNPADKPILFLAISSDAMTIYQLYEYVETLINPKIAMLPGVAQVKVFGSPKYAVRVQLNPLQLAARGIGFEAIETAIVKACDITPLGVLNGNKQLMNLQIADQPLNGKDLRQIIVQYNQGSPVRLSDLANIIDSIQDNKSASWLKERPAILLAIQRQPDANTIKIVDNIKALLPFLKEQIPSSINIDVTMDRSLSVRDSIADVQHSLTITMGLVILVIFLFLRKVSATFITALALPLSFLATLAGMYFCNCSLNNVSLLALTISVGFVVDDAIVMLENIARHIEKGMKPFQAAIYGAKEIGFTIMSMTISLVAVFIPIMFMGDVVGRIFREFAITISLAILISGFVSLTLTPMLCSRLLKSNPSDKKMSKVSQFLERMFDNLLDCYERSLQKVMQWRRLTLALTALSLVISVVLFILIPKSFLPLEDTGFMFIYSEGPEDISFDEMKLKQQRVASIIAQNPYVETYSSSVTLNTGRLYITLKAREDRPSINTIIEQLQKDLDNVEGVNVFPQAIQNFQSGSRFSKSMYQYTLQGTSLDEVYKWGTLLEKKLKEIPGFLNVTTDLMMKSLQVSLKFNFQEAALYGVDMQIFRRALYRAFGESQITTLYTANNNYQVLLEVAPQFQRNFQDIQNIYVTGNNNQQVPLKNFTTLSKGITPLTINHQDALPAGTITFDLKEGFSIEKAREEIYALQNAIGLPVTVKGSFAGNTMAFQDSAIGENVLVLLTVLAIYIILGILYESFVHPLTILSGLPSASLGALVTLIISGQELSVVALIGITMLMGIVKKNAIMMIDFAIKQHSSISAEEAIYQACLQRFRPIMMTTMAAILGAVPIAFGTGAGSELRRPLGITIIGGLLFSQVLTLYITPVVYLYLERWSKWMEKKLSSPIDTEANPSL